MLRFDCVKKQGFVIQNKKQKNTKPTFGMNPISKTKDKITSNLAPLASDVYQIGNSIASSNSQQNLQQQNLNSAYSNIELVEVITSSQQNDSLNAISQNPLQNNLSLPQDDSDSDDEFYEKDMEADKYLNSCSQQCAKVLTCVPVIGGFAAINIISTRSKELDKIYDVPEYLPIYYHNQTPNSDKLLAAIIILHLTVIGSIIATPLAILNIKNIKKDINKELKDSYRTAYKKEQEQAKNETPYQTRFRHAKLKKNYYKDIAESRYKEHLRKQEQSRERARSARYNNYHSNKPKPQRTGGGR